ncbi:MAG: 50S rRNA methyltransferase [Phycisphaerae bacterium]|nr:50S rRNA methyltransferase [Phycisphaerae bacterium]
MTIFMPREVQDHWFKEAKRQGYRSRAAFKLTEIDDKRKILRKGRRILDLGCAPGSWMQVAAQRVGPGGLVVGIDLQPVTGNIQGSEVHIVQGDVANMDDAMLQQLGLDPQVPFDVILSDMAPATTGSKDTDHYGSMNLCEQVLDMAGSRLCVDGDLVIKTFEGPGSKDLVDRMKDMFETVRPAKPKASRSVSREMFLVGLKLKPGVVTESRPSAPKGGPPPLPGGWGR